MACRLVIAGGDGAQVLELVEEALDQVALTIEGEVGLARDPAIGLGWHDRGDRLCVAGLDQRIGVIRLVRQAGLRLGMLQQRLGLAEIAGLAGRQGEGNGMAQRSDQGMDLGGQSASRTSAGLVLAPFFRAPALGWWARTMVASSILYALSRSCANVLKTRSKTPLLAQRSKRCQTLCQSPKRPGRWHQAMPAR